MHNLKIELAVVKIDGALFFPNDNLPGEFDLTYNQPQVTAEKVCTPGNFVHLAAGNFRLNEMSTPLRPTLHIGQKLLQAKIDGRWVTLTAHCYNGEDGYRPEGRYARTQYHCFVHLNGDPNNAPAFNDYSGNLHPAESDWACYCISAD